MAIKPRNEIQAALIWLDGAGFDTQRAVSMRCGGEDEYMIKYFENSIVVKEFVIKGRRAWHNMLGGV